MTRPTVDACTVSAHLDLTQPGSFEIHNAETTGGHAVYVGFDESGSRLALFLTPGSLAALRDAATTHLSGDI